MATSKSQRNGSLARLHEILKPGDTVHTIQRHVSRSGMMREISVIGPNNEDITWHVMHVGGYRRSDKTGALRVSGCGMDMGFHVVYNLGRAMWPDGTPDPHGTRNGEPDRDGGYALKHLWL